MSNSIVQKQLTFRGNSYLISYPTVGQFIDIRVIEQQLSKGTLKELLSGLGSSIDAFLYITTFAHIQILVPELIKDLRVKSLLDLQVEEFDELADLYSEHIAPWLQEWMDKMKEKVVSKSDNSSK